jgi:hypothetical protein
LKKANNPIPLPGYIPLDRLLELNRDALRALPKVERQEVSKALLREIIIWSSYSYYEGIGVLHTLMYHYISETEEKEYKRY